MYREKIAADFSNKIMACIIEEHISMEESKNEWTFQLQLLLFGYQETWFFDEVQSSIFCERLKLNK
jgi:hypothetical protein